MQLLSLYVTLYQDAKILNSRDSRHQHVNVEVASASTRHCLLRLTEQAYSGIAGKLLLQLEGTFLLVLGLRLPSEVESESLVHHIGERDGASS